MAVYCACFLITFLAVSDSCHTGSKPLPRIVRQSRRTPLFWASCPKGLIRASNPLTNVWISVRVALRSRAHGTRKISRSSTSAARRRLFTVGRVSHWFLTGRLQPPRTVGEGGYTAKHSGVLTGNSGPAAAGGGRRGYSLGTLPFACQSRSPMRQVTSDGGPRPGFLLHTFCFIQLNRYQQKRNT